MTDIFSKKKRSEIMSKIRGKNTSPEIRLAKYLKKAKIRYRKYAKLPGTPDFVLIDYKTAIFCDGKFWHGFEYSKWKKRLTKFWKQKIESNIMRDLKNRNRLRRMGWTVIRIWDFEINKDAEKCITKIKRKIHLKRQISSQE